MRATILAVILAAAPATAQHADAPYAGLDGREVASLSPDDLAELRRGGGWGLALPAELAGVPGPAHLLELAGEIGLDPAQVAAIEAERDAMRAGAIEAGARLIEAERALDAAFRDGPPDEAALRRLVEGAAAARGALRLVHLSSHLAMAEVVRPDQAARYARLRGYGLDPCAEVPEGHDPAMWRRHQGCQ